MSNKGKKCTLIWDIRTIFCFGILVILMLSNIIYLRDISISLPSTMNNSTPQNWNSEEINTFEIAKETFTNSQDITANTGPLKVVIGTVVCHEPNDLSPREEALVLLKSAIFSAVLYQTFPINIQFHLFIEQETDEEYFLENIHPFSEILDEIQVDMYFYSVFDAVPHEHHNLVFGPGLRCTYVRIFFPSALPEVDSILYLDTDVIITGDLAEIWHNFGKMDDIQLVGAAMDIEPDNEAWFHIYEASFQNTPVPTPRGLNGGVLLMNLTRMRDYQFEDKIMRLYNDYSIVKNDQNLLNALLFYNPNLLYLLPCQYNFRHTACTLGLYCTGVLDDPIGVQIIHSYQEPNILGTENAFRDIAEAYQNITRADVDFRVDLLLKVRSMYKAGFRSAYDHRECNGVLDTLLFRKLF